MRLLFIALCAVLAACSSGGGDGGLLQGCHSVSGAVTGTVSVGCLSCGAENLDQIADGDGATYGSIEMPDAANGTGTLLVNHGNTLPAGSLVGMVHSIEYQTSVVNISMTTYLDGVLQETFTENNFGGASDMAPSRTGRISHDTTKAYDAIELSITRSSGTGAVSARVHEFCSN